MHFSKISAIIVTVLAASVAAAPSPNSRKAPIPDKMPEHFEIAPGQDTQVGDGKIAKRGFGCPDDEYECHYHCQDGGRAGGYCGGVWWFGYQTCICYW